MRLTHEAQVIPVTGNVTSVEDSPSPACGRGGWGAVGIEGPNGGVERAGASGPV
jgi:hypothetical protein